MKEKISESLAGRKRLFELATVSFGEFSDYRTDYRYTNRLREFFRTEPARTEQLCRKYLMYDGKAYFFLKQSIRQFPPAYFVSTYIQ